LSGSARVNLIGWFEHGNAGDDLIASSMRGYWATRGIAVNLIDTDPLRRAQDLPPADWVVLAGGDHWHEDFAENFAKFLSYMDLPFAVAGMGVAAMTNGMREATESLLARSRFTWLRDQTSFVLVGNDGRCRLGPDVTWVDPVAVSRDSGPLRIGVNLRPWPLGSWRAPLWDSSSWLRVLAGLRAELVPLPLYVGPGRNDRLLLAQLGRPVPQRFDRGLVDGLGLVVSMRLHGLIFAAQAGIPVVGIAYQPKCRRFMAELGLEEYCLALDEADRLAETVASALEHRDGIRERLLAARETLHGRATELMAELTRLILAEGQ
jgi:polysaccharide pyruvyl transferase WcaK-like protein